jgi:adenosylcobinamide-GDP ribazoletransferase
VRTWLDGALLAVGTFTRLPVRPPSAVSRPVAARAMVLAPLVGAALAAVAAGVLVLVQRLGSGLGATSLLPATLAVAALAWMTGALHLDGLADVADGLGSRRPDPRALEIMRRPDIGPMGVVVVVLVLLVQVIALAQATVAGAGTAAVVLAVVAGRVGIVVACTRGIEAARPDGLGAAVAGTVAAPVTALVVAALALLAAALGGAGAGGPVRTVVAVAAGLAVGGALLVRAVRRLGGVTGDVLGATSEVTTTATLLALALSLPG